MGSGAKYLKKEREKIKARESLPSPPLLFIAFFTSHRSPLSEHLEQASEQALRGALAAGREKGGELATTSLEFEYLHRESRCEMLIGGDDISNDVITFGT